jgi:hypothetical protein
MNSSHSRFVQSTGALFGSSSLLRVCSVTVAKRKGCARTPEPMLQHHLCANTCARSYIRIAGIHRLRSVSHDSVSDKKSAGGAPYICLGGWGGGKDLMDIRVQSLHGHSASASFTLSSNSLLFTEPVSADGIQWLNSSNANANEDLRSRWDV